MAAIRARFTPRAMPPELQETLFVARHRILDEITNTITDAINTDERGHRVFIGPRGAGKTHLVSLAYHRTLTRQRAGEPVQPVMLPEDPWRITSYKRLLTAIITELDPDTTTKDLDERALENIIKNTANDHGVIVVFLENLDQLLIGIGESGQQQLRSFTQNHNALLLVATSTQLSDDLTNSIKPFYGFFAPWQLEPFNVDDAQTMLAAIARSDGNNELADALHTDRARSRLQAAEALAGGQPRIWALLATAITLDNLDDTVNLLFTQFDDLTAYYQERLARFSAVQREIVLALAAHGGAANVKTIAELADIGEGQTANALRKLNDNGWVSEPSSALTQLLDQRQRFYELNEPLLRVAVELKESKGEPASLIVDFLTAWFEPDDISDAIKQLLQQVSLATDTTATDQVALGYLNAARAIFQDDATNATVRALTDRPSTNTRSDGHLLDADHALEQLQLHNDPTQLLSLPSPIRRVLEDQIDAEPQSRRIELHHRALNTRATEHPDPWLQQAETLGSSEDALVVKSIWHIHKREPETALALLDDTMLVEHFGSVASTLYAAGFIDHLIPLTERLADHVTRTRQPLNQEQHDGWSELRISAESAWMWVGTLLRVEKRHEESVDAFRRSLTLTGQVAGADAFVRYELARGLLLANELEEAHKEATVAQDLALKHWGRESDFPGDVQQLREDIEAKMGNTV